MTSVTAEYVAEIINKFEVSDENKQNGVLGIDGKVHIFIFPDLFIMIYHSLFFSISMLFAVFHRMK